MFSHHLASLKRQSRYELTTPTPRQSDKCHYGGWIAQITGRCEKFGLARKFAKKAWNMGGQEMYWQVEEGPVYQYGRMYAAGETDDTYTKNMDSDDERRKGFFRIVEGRLQAVKRGQVLAQFGIESF